MGGWVIGFTSCISAPCGLIGQAGTLAMRRSALVARDETASQHRLPGRDLNLGPSD